MTVTITSTAHKVAAGVITAAIIGLFTVFFSSVSGKTDNETFDKHCIENEKRFEKVEQTNEKVLEVLMEIRLDVKELQTIERQKKDR